MLPTGCSGRVTGIWRNPGVLLPIQDLESYDMQWETVIGLRFMPNWPPAQKFFGGIDCFRCRAQYPGLCGGLGAARCTAGAESEAVVMAVRFSAAINADLERRSVAARKNYFYPDLPKFIPDQPV